MSAVHEQVIRSLKDQYGNPLWPACETCGKSVDRYSLEDMWKLFGGPYFLDVKAECHGAAPEVHRIFHPPQWLHNKKTGERIVNPLMLRTAIAFLKFYVAGSPRRTYAVHWPSNKITIENWSR